MYGKLAKAVLTLIQSKKGRKVLKTTLIIALSPLILILIFIVSGADGASNHNNELINVLFQDKEISASVPYEYEQFLLNYKTAFTKIDEEISSLEMSSGQLDAVLIKSILFVVYLEEPTNYPVTQINTSEYVGLFYTKEKVEIEDESDVTDPSKNKQVESETTIVLTPIHSTESLIQKATDYLQKDIASKKDMLYEIYNVALTGINKSLDGYTPMSELLKDAYLNSEQSPYIGGHFRSPLEDDWKQYVTSEFGPRDPITLPDGSITGSYHTGIDFGRPTGTPLLAVGDGTVVVVRYTDIGLGFFTVIDHGGGIFTVYGHMSRIHVTENQVVKQGQLIGEVGNTGYSTGAHLHFEVIVNQNYVNPKNYLK